MPGIMLPVALLVSPLIWTGKNHRDAGISGSNGAAEMYQN